MRDRPGYGGGLVWWTAAGPSFRKRGQMETVCLGNASHRTGLAEEEASVSSPGEKVGQGMCRVLVARQTFDIRQPGTAKD